MPRDTSKSWDIKKWVANNNCPVCDSFLHVRNDICFLNDNVAIDWFCDDCRSTWTENYILKNIVYDNDMQEYTIKDEPNEKK